MKKTIFATIAASAVMYRFPCVALPLDFAWTLVEPQAVDYLLKPLQAARFQKTVQKLHFAQMQRAQRAINSEAIMKQTLNRLRALLTAQRPAGPVAAPTLQMISLTASAEFLIRTALKDLLPRLDPQLRLSSSQ